MAAGKLDLPGDFQAGKQYLIRGETMLKWRKALQADRPLAGPGIRETGTPGGRVFEVESRDTLPGFHPYRMERISATEWKVFLTPAMVAARSAADGAPPLAWLVPKIGATAITSDPPPYLTMVSGDYATLRLQTTKPGAPSGDAVISAGASADGAFHLPVGVGPGGTAGQDGDYRFKLFRFEIAGGRPEIIPYQLDTIEWLPWLWTGDFVGGGNGKIYRHYNPATGRHEFRSIESPHAAHGALGNPVTTATEIELRGNGFWGDVRFEECASDGIGSPVLKGILAIRDGLASMHASDVGVPSFPDGITPANFTFTYANCHCCGEGP